MTEENDQKRVLLLTPMDGPLQDTAGDISQIENTEVMELTFKDFTLKKFIECCPCVVLTSNFEKSVKILNACKMVLDATKSRVIGVYAEGLSTKKTQMLWNFNIADILSGDEARKKTIIHKIKMQQGKVGTKLELKNAVTVKGREKEAVVENDTQAIKSLADLPKYEKECSEKAEINYETVDYMAVTKFCNDSLRKLVELEEKLELYETSPSSTQLESIIETFSDIGTKATELGLGVIGTFLTLITHICQSLEKITEDVFRNVLVGILLNTVDFLRSEISNIKEKKSRRQILDNPHKALFGRYRWVSDKLRSTLDDSKMDDIMLEIGI